jgi:hypothetical protein
MFSFMVFSVFKKESTTEAHTTRLHSGSHAPTQKCNVSSSAPYIQQVW